MYLCLVILPILGSIASGFFGRKVGVNGSESITIICVMLTMAIAFLTFFEIGFNNMTVDLELFKWIDVESLYVLWEFNFDSVTVSMLIPVLIVSWLVHVYSVGYMDHDPHIQRFFSYLSLFTFMMIILVTGNNLLVMFVGWEGVGICSYLLVNFWYTRIAANQSSVAALLTNRVGDCFLTVGMFIVLWTYGSLDYATIFSLAPFSNDIAIHLIGGCILIGAMAKSSQIGLHVWLPMAMEGPTPVSALIHAATMVTAGVYLLIRCSPIVEYSTIVLLLCVWVGGITTMSSSIIGLFQQDIKKVIAYSTMSQLGMMVIAVGLSSYTLALFHLINHAFYKALLFLAAGGVIHAMGDNQDFRKYGGLRAFLPLTYSVMLIGSLSLVAFPFMTGFYSKDLILESLYGGFYFSAIAVYIIATTGAIFTSLYSVKVLYLTFLANPQGSLSDHNNAHEGNIFMTFPLIVLAAFSIFSGFITKDIYTGLGSGFFSDNSIFVYPIHETMLDTEFAVPTLFKLLPFIITIFSIFISIWMLEISPEKLTSVKLTNLVKECFSFFNQRLYIEFFYNKYITEVILKLGGQTSKVLDKGSIELIGPFGLERGLSFLSNSISKLDTGVITSYALYILIGLIIYLLIPYFALTSVLLIILINLVSLSSGSKEWRKLEIYNPPKPNMFASKHLESGILPKHYIYIMFTFILVIISIIYYMNTSHHESLAIMEPSEFIIYLCYNFNDYININNDIFSNDLEMYSSFDSQEFEVDSKDILKNSNIQCMDGGDDDSNNELSASDSGIADMDSDPEVYMEWEETAAQEMEEEGDTDSEDFSGDEQFKSHVCDLVKEAEEKTKELSESDLSKADISKMVDLEKFARETKVTIEETQKVVDSKELNTEQFKNSSNNIEKYITTLESETSKKQANNDLNRAIQINITKHSLRDLKNSMDNISKE